jgi:hypothetical protein
MQIGDLVIRRVFHTSDPQCSRARKQREKLGAGFVLSKQLAGKPRHPCVTVLYPKTGQVWDIAESLLEVISECR